MGNKRRQKVCVYNVTFPLGWIYNEKHEMGLQYTYVVDCNSYFFRLVFCVYHLQFMIDVDSENN